MQTMLAPPKEEDVMEADTFNLGVIKGGDLTPFMTLFSIPNEGNIQFEYSIFIDSEVITVPVGAELLTGDEGFFEIEPKTGILAPGESINVCGSFHAITTGLYRQRYIVRSFEEDILKFTLVGHVGNPELKVSTRLIDFGLIERGKSFTKALLISNIGSYQDQWRIECKILGDAAYSDRLPFTICLDSGETMANQNSAVPISFDPSNEGEFKASVNVIWSRGNFNIDLIGIGGGSKLEFFYLDDHETIFNGIDFGICIVGMNFEKYFGIKNVGTVDALINISHPNQCVKFEICRNDLGEIRIPPQNSITARVNFSPSQPELIRDPITLDMGNSGMQTVSFKAKCGAHAWNCIGDLNFLNMLVGESQSKIIAVQNTGTLDIPFEIALEPTLISQNVHFISLDNWIPGRQLRPGQTVSFEVFISSDIAMLLEGNILVKTTLGGVSKAHSFAFKSRTYVQEVALDKTEDVGVGRVMVGESITYSWNIDNYGNQPINYRVKIENLDSEATQQVIDGIKFEAIKKTPNRPTSNGDKVTNSTGINDHPLSGGEKLGENDRAGTPKKGKKGTPAKKVTEAEAWSLIAPQKEGN